MKLLIWHESILEWSLRFMGHITALILKSTFTCENLDPQPWIQGLRSWQWLLVLITCSTCHVLIVRFVRLFRIWFSWPWHLINTALVSAALIKCFYYSAPAPCRNLVQLMLAFDGPDLFLAGIDRTLLFFLWPWDHLRSQLRFAINSYCRNLLVFFPPFHSHLSTIEF